MTSGAQDYLLRGLHLFSPDKKYMMAATEELFSDWLNEDIIIVLHDVFDNAAFCLDKYVFKTKLM